MFDVHVRLVVLRTPTVSDGLNGLFLREGCGGAKMRTNFTIPSTDLNVLIVLVVGRLTIPCMRFSPILIPSAVSTRQNI